MPLARPPAATASPRAVELSAGTPLWRVHRRSRSGLDFKNGAADPNFGGNRFDSTPDDPYPYLYVASDPQTAVLETLVRGIPFNDKGERVVRRAAIAGYRLTAIEPVLSLTLVTLQTTADLAAVCQDEWLIHASPGEYPQTRRWGRWLRSQALWAQGLIWPSGRNLGRQSVVLFGDRIPAGAFRLVLGAVVDLDDIEGAAWLNAWLAPYRTSVRAPSARLLSSLRRSLDSRQLGHIPAERLRGVGLRSLPGRQPA